MRIACRSRMDTRPPLGYHPWPQVQVCTTPALRVAAVSNPIRLSQTPAKQGSDSPCLTPKKDDGRA
jgi:hypothetical protein